MNQEQSTIKEKTMLNAHITTIPHNAQRYNTVGDYETKDSITEIRVSDMGDWRAEAAVAIHEFIEVLLCRYAGVTDQEIDEFDMSFQSIDGSEPGDDPRAPYHRQHQVATKIERMLVEELGLDWSEYDGRIRKMMQGEI